MTGEEEIRPLARGDLPEVAALLVEGGRRSGSVPPAPVEDHLARTLLDHPWADPALCSLVAVDGAGEIVGLIASYARRMVVDGRPLSVRVPGGFVTTERARGRGLGTRLVAAVLDGPQDLTLADGANELARRRWAANGGHVLVHASLGWRRVLRPAAAAAGGPWVARRPAAVRHPVAALTRPVDAAVDAVPPLRRRVRPVPPPSVGEPLSAVKMSRLVAASGRRLRPDYDPEYLTWLFDELEPAGVVRTLVRAERGPVGWYVYAPGERTQVLQIGACDPDRTGDVLDHLLADAYARGAAVVEGRLEPDLAVALRKRRVTLYSTTWTLARAADPTVAALLTSPDGMLSRLDGEWWIGFLLWDAPGLGGPTRSGGARSGPVPRR